MLNKIENLICDLKSGQVIFLGHSAVIVNVGGIRIGFDLATKNGRMHSPFNNLRIKGANSFTHLLPLVRSESHIARPQEIASFLDIVIYSHLHSDHFSLNYLAILKETNPNIRIICPENTKKYLKGVTHYKYEINATLIEKIKSFMVKKFFPEISLSVDNLDTELDSSNAQDKLIDSIEEISLSSPIVIPGKEKDTLISAFATTHPAYQMYIKMPCEFESPPGVFGYIIKYGSVEKDHSIIYIGEGASDPDTLERIFSERDQLALLMFPITEQTESKGSQFLQEFIAHSSLRTLAIVERLVSDGTKIIPLHQGLWYFQLSPIDIVKARKSLDKLGGNRDVTLPFVALSLEFRSIASKNRTSKSYISQKKYLSGIFSTVRIRWQQYKKIAKIVGKLPISGKVEGFSVGSTTYFSNTVTQETERPKFNKETLKMSIQAMLMEYQVLHQEVDRAWEWQTNIINFILLIIGSIVTLVNVFPDLELLFITGSFFLTALGWIFIEKSIHMIRIGRYYILELIPRANQLLQLLESIDAHNPFAEKIKILSYEEFFRSGDVQTALQGFASLGRFFIAVFPGVAFAIAFFIIKHYSGDVWLFLEKVLFILATSMSVLPLVAAIINGRFAFTGKNK